MVYPFTGSLRLFLFAAPFSGAFGQSPTVVPRDSGTIVFVCEHGTVKSVVALAYFARLAQERNLPYRAISRGINPDPVVPSVVLNGLRADGLTLRAFTPGPFTAADLASALLVVSFDQPSVSHAVGDRVPTSAWDGLPAVSENYGVARDAIRARVEWLVDSLATARRRPAAPQSQEAETELALRALEDELSSRPGHDTVFLLNRFEAATKDGPGFGPWLESFLSERWRQGIPRGLFESYWQANQKSRDFPVPRSILGRPVLVATNLNESSIPEGSGVRSVSRAGFNQAGDSALISVNFVCRGLCGSESVWLYVRRGQQWERRVHVLHMVH